VGGLPAPWNTNENLIGHLLRFDPREKESSTSRITSIPLALWNLEQECDLYIYKGRGGTGSSLFEQNVDYVKQNFEQLRHRGNADLAETWFERSTLVKAERILCRTLDQVLSELPPRNYHFLKIDAQGADYQILLGAERLLASGIVGLHLELFTIPLYKGIVLLPDVETHLANRGFRLRKKMPAHGSFDSQHDCLFIKEQGDPQLVKMIEKVYGI
jgi:FkbM family methyltransferase